MLYSARLCTKRGQDCTRKERRNWRNKSERLGLSPQRRCPWLKDRESWGTGVYSRLDGATSLADLEARADEIRRKIASAVYSIKRRKGWM